MSLVLVHLGAGEVALAAACVGSVPLYEVLVQDVIIAGIAAGETRAPYKARTQGNAVKK